LAHDLLNTRRTQIIIKNINETREDNRIHRGDHYSRPGLWMDRLVLSILHAVQNTQAIQSIAQYLNQRTQATPVPTGK
jgi:hypothetical protein